jgi:glycosyltransferase involved in cell wall biosynthesis
VSVLGGDAIFLPEINYGQLRSKLSQKLVVWTLHNAFAPIALTKYLEDNLRCYGLTKNLLIVPWGIDKNLFSYKEKDIAPPIQFLHIGNLHPVKDQDTLLRAFKIISDQVSAQLTIIGRGELKESLKKLISDLNLEDKVSLIDPLPYESLPVFYHNADILLHTSLSEGQCEVVTEAMSAGVLVCGTSVGLMYDKPDCCITVDVKDFNRLASNVLRLINDSERIRSLKSNAYKFAATHDIYWTIEKISKIYISTDQPMIGRQQ